MATYRLIPDTHYTMVGIFAGMTTMQDANLPQGRIPCGLKGEIINDASNEIHMSKWDSNTD